MLRKLFFIFYFCPKKNIVVDSNPSLCLPFDELNIQFFIKFNFHPQCFPYFIYTSYFSYDYNHRFMLRKYLVEGYNFSI